MPPAVTRELSVTYAGVTLGGTDSNNLLFDRHVIEGGYDTLSFRGFVVVRADTEANFATACAALETAFQTPNGTLVISQGSSTMKSFGHSGSTGFLGRPHFRKVGGREDTSRSRLYEVSVTAQRPADLSGKDGLQVASIAVTTKFFGARSYRVTGTYTAISSTSARAKYAASVGALLTSIETDLGGSPGTWLRMDASVSYDDENKVAHFTQDVLENGLRDATYSLQTTQTALRSYRVTGSYTAVGGTGATATYTGAIGAILTTFEGSLGGTWLRGASSYVVDQGDKLLTFEYSALETGLRDAVYNVVTLPTGQRVYTVTGKYEKVGGTGALSTYTSAIAAVLSAFESGLTGTWERTQSLYAKDQTDTIITFEWRGTELIYNQSSGVLDNTSLANTRIRIQPGRIAPGDTGGTAVVRPVRVMALIDTDVVKSSTQDLKSLWENTVRPYLIDRAKTAVNATAAALIEERPDYDFSGNRISGAVLIETYVGSSLLQQEIETEDETKTGIVLIDVWSGDPDAKEEYQVSRQITRSVTTRTLTLGVSANPAGGGGGGVGGAGAGAVASATGVGAPPASSTPTGFALMSTRTSTKPLTVGLSGNQVDLLVKTTVDVYQFRNKVGGGGGDQLTSNRP